MSYEVFTTAKVDKAVTRLPGTVYQRMKDVIDGLAIDPRPSGCESLSGRDGYRIRVGEYRGIYRVDDREQRVEVLRVAHRRDVYRR